MVTSSSSSPALYALTLSSVLSIKLERNNCLLWLADKVLLLRSRNLSKFVEGTFFLPMEFLLDESDMDSNADKNDLIPNPQYELWIQQDQQLLSWINNFLSPTILSPMTLNISARQTWVELEHRFSSTSKSCLFELRQELTKIVCADLSITDWLDKLNSITQNLVLTGNPVSDKELINHILAMVGSTYETTVTEVLSHEHWIDYLDHEPLLLGVE